MHVQHRILLHIWMRPIHTKSMGAKHEKCRHKLSRWSLELWADACFMQQIHWCKWLLLLIERNTWKISTFSPYDSMHFASIFKYSSISLNYKLNSVAALHHLQFPWLIIIWATISLLLLSSLSFNIWLFLQSKQRISKTLREMSDIKAKLRFSFYLCF